MSHAAPSRNAVVITGTDTGVGKTVVAAMLTLALGADYWKPVQAGGLDGETDTQAVRRLTGMPAGHFHIEAYRLTAPLSPHQAAKQDDIEIDDAWLQLPEQKPERQRLMIIEGAGGLMVPLRDDLLQIDLYARWQLPVVLVARTSLGAINHALLSIEAMKARAVNIHGIVFVGDEMADTERTICEMGRVKRLGRLPKLAVLNRASLTDAFAEHFDLADFAKLRRHK